ncbi:MAG: InlB B-repeat-containing protein [Candidatus Omnitrophica bacterium]|nr:InlB B-repeat-containing protein [Candidatus Omnitrophota bacterium]
MKKNLILACLFLFVSTMDIPVVWAETIGAEAVQQLPPSSLWSSVVSFRPGDGEEVMLNPPRFSWSYNPDSRDAKIDVSPKEFIFQVAYSKSALEYARTLDNPLNAPNLVVSVRTPSNCYNFLAPFDPNQRVYWQIGYINPLNLVLNNHYWPSLWNNWNLRLWDNNNIIWSDIRSFTIKHDPADPDNPEKNALIWDRSMLKDWSEGGYLKTKAAHPHMLFNAQNRNGLYLYLKGLEAKYISVFQGSFPSNGSVRDKLEFETGKGWYYTKIFTRQAITSTWWNEEKPPIRREAMADYIAQAAFVYQMLKDVHDHQDPDYALAEQLRNTDMVNPLLRVVRDYLSARGDRTDTCSGAVGNMIFNIALAYDWLYELMNNTQRQEVLNAIELRCKYMTRDYWWWYSYRDGGQPGEYLGPFTVGVGSGAKANHSHIMNDFNEAIKAVLAAFGDSTDPATHTASGATREFFELGVNYLIGVTYPFGWEGDSNQGRGYGAINITQILATSVIYQMTLPEAGFNRNPLFPAARDWWSRMVFVDFTALENQWADTGGGRLWLWQDNTWGRNVALFLKSQYPEESGKAIQQWEKELAVYQGYRHPDSFEQLPVLFHFSPNDAPVARDSDSSGKLFSSQGWVISSTYPSNTERCLNDGAGFVFLARPNAQDGHSNHADLSFDMWAYGVMFTNAGSGYSAYGKIPLSHYTLLIDGLQMADDGTARLPYFNRIFAFKDTADYTYVAADGTNAYPRSVFSPAMSDVSDLQYFNLHYRGPLSYLKKVHRHILFMHKKYFIVYDDLETDAERPATFSWVYHILEDDLRLDASTASFNYRATNRYKYDSATFATTPPPLTSVDVYVTQVHQPQTGWDVRDMRGRQVRSNPLTGEDYFYSGNNSKYYNSHSLFVSNREKTSKFHFMTAIYPKRSGQTQPQIVRLDDYTVAVTDDGSYDIIRFYPDEPAAQERLADVSPTMQVDLRKVKPDRYATDGLLPNTYRLNVSDDGHGFVLINPESRKRAYTAGTQITIKAIPQDEGYEFAGWSGDASGTANPLTIVMDGNKEIAANFRRKPGLFKLVLFTLHSTVRTSDNSGRTYYPAGQSLVLTAIPDEGYEFAGWSGDASGTANPLTIVMNSDKYIWVNSQRQPNKYEVVVEGGTGEVVKVPNKKFYDPGEKVSLFAYADASWRGHFQFNGWSGSGISSADALINPLTIIVNEDRFITANFSKGDGNSRWLRVRKQGNGSLNFSTGDRLYAQGTTAVLEATPASGSRFDRWTGDVPAGREQDNPLSVLMDSDRTITANFVPLSTVLYGDVSGDGKVSAYDVALTVLTALGVNMGGFNLPQDYQARADVDGVAGVTLADAALIAQRAVGLITGFPGQP